ncbi:L,D-transpeptidase [Kibdelosporangium philippinense]|uniref:L,D-transpeptidase n=1 Tax=Kibdelosporangium philippinense TaxID=211113 RepID=A0ABS8ZPM0_9PSEU|nr:L,D-transpeptidase [Kibdelosporangium philippinense]MCE7008576.1 L,D-transpeptidase [Kibdelosporangium philippinense]
MRLALVLPAAALLLAACSTAPQQAVQAAPPPPPSTTTTSSPSPEPQAQPVVVPTAPCTAPAIRACASLSLKLAWLMKDGVAEHGPVPITHGRPGHETPVGTFKVAWKDAEHTSSIYRTPMPHSVFFTAGGIAFHEGSLNEDSHGCVHLSPEAAKIFFDALPVQAGVQVMA